MLLSYTEGATGHSKTGESGLNNGHKNVREWRWHENRVYLCPGSKKSHTTECMKIIDKNLFETSRKKLLMIQIQGCIKKREYQTTFLYPLNLRDSYTKWPHKIMWILNSLLLDSWRSINKHSIGRKWEIFTLFDLSNKLTSRLSLSINFLQAELCVCLFKLTIHSNRAETATV